MTKILIQQFINMEPQFDMKPHSYKEAIEMKVPKGFDLMIIHKVKMDTFIFLAVSVLAYFCAKYKTFYFILIVFYAVMICHSIVQNNIYGEYIADYLLLSVQLGIISLLSLIEVIKDLPPLKRKVFSHNYRFS